MINSLLLGSILFLILDSVYLSTMKPHFDKMVTKIQGSPIDFRMSGAIFCYAFLLLGWYYFILRERKPVFDAFLFGLVIYAVYEFTNYAIIKDWAVWSVVIDTLWGGILYATTTALVYRFV